MKKQLHLLALLFGLAALTASAAEPKTPTERQRQSVNSKPETAADAYPLQTCLVSDEPLGSMGDAVVYTHKEPGKPDRVVRFCCEGCIEDFRANPEKFLKKLDAAEAAAAKKKSGGTKNKS